MGQPPSASWRDRMWRAALASCAGSAIRSQRRSSRYSDVMVASASNSWTQKPAASWHASRASIPLWRARSSADACVASCGRGARKGRGFMMTPSSSEVPPQHLPEVFPALADLPDHGVLEPAVHHAIRAARIALVLVLFPVGLGHELVEGPVMAVRDQVTRTLPTLRVVVRPAPRRALEVALALKEPQVHRRAQDAVLLGELPDALEFL